MKRAYLALLATFLALAMVTLLAPSPPNQVASGQAAISVGLNIPLAPADVGVAQAINHKEAVKVVMAATANKMDRADFALTSDMPNQATGGAHSARNAPMTAIAANTGNGAAKLKVPVNIRT